jgi:hypothetical protein
VFIQLLDASTSRDLYLYRQQYVTLWLINAQIFLKQTKSQILIGLHLFWKNQIVRFDKSDDPIFATLTSCLIFFYLDPLVPFSLFYSFKTPWIFKSSSLAPFFDLTLKLLKPNTPIWQTRQSNFFNLIKFGHQHNHYHIQKLVIMDTPIWAWVNGWKIASLR